MNKNQNKREIIYLTRGRVLSPGQLESELEDLHSIVGAGETIENFCRIFELLNRNRITTSKIRILEFLRDSEEKPFRFLINKN
jgi:hypothetical protein